MKTVLALDLASVTGWAFGEPGDRPKYGSQRFASAGASHEAVFFAAARWMSNACDDLAPDVVVWEAPLATIFKRGSTNTATTTLLYGLPAVMGMTAYAHDVFDIRKADTRDVRLHFIGSNPKRVKAKPMVMQQCHTMGWPVTDDNQADALATWHYMCSLLEPSIAVRPLPLFGAR